MTNSIDYDFKTTVIGSMPHKDAESACRLLTRHLKDIPAWPQLPCRSGLEGMVVQFSRKFPGLSIIDGNAAFSRADRFEKSLESLYNAYLADDYAYFGVTPEYAAGLHCFLKTGELHTWAVKGQITGPISWCFDIKDEAGKSILYDNILSDAATCMLALSVAWQEKELSKINKNTIIFVDEPSLSIYESAFFNLPPEKITGLINKVLSKIKGVKGIHCCGNTDWGLVLSTDVDVLSFDAYNYGSTLNPYPDAVKNLLSRGGGIAWGIVPNTEAELLSETPASLKDRLEDIIAPFTRTGISFGQIASRSMLTPSCSLSLLTEEGAEHALVMLNSLSDLMQTKYL